MEFTSIFFIWVLLPLTLAAYCAARRAGGGACNAILLLVSLLFYVGGGIKALLLLLCMTAANYALGLRIDGCDGSDAAASARRRRTFVAALLVNLAILAFFKYFNMLIALAEILISPAGRSLRGLLAALSRMERTGALPVRSLEMPLAISFVTFQSISYLADVYHRRVRAERDPLSFLLYIALFFQLTQGPIMRYGDLGAQIHRREHSSERFASGIRRFCWGMGKKVLIANALAAPVNRIWAAEAADIGTGVAWLGLLFYTLQIYYDFSGYTDMAIGLGRMFGFEIAENFNHPYTSLSVREFWRRWHISLSSWFRDYLYIPLGGSRRGKGRTLFNLFIVFLATGIWHGANLNFLAWGLLFAAAVVLERLFLGELLRRNPFKPLNWLYATFVVMMGWVLFRAPNLHAALGYFRALFCRQPATFGVPVASYLSPSVWVALLAGVLLSGAVQRPLRGVVEAWRERPLFQLCAGVLALAVLAWALVLTISGSYNPSIYAAF